MKWLNNYGRALKREEIKESLVGVERKHFAWLPVDIGTECVWLRTYYSMYCIDRFKDNNGLYFSMGIKECHYLQMKEQEK